MRKHYDLDAPMHQALATLQAPGEEEEAQTHGEEEPATIHVYPVAGGGILFSQVPLDQEEATIIESHAPDTEMSLTKHPTTPGKERPCFFSFLLILGFFLLFDMADSQMTALLTPTITVTITPKAQTISTTATFPIDANGNGAPGRVSPAFTLTQSASTSATGHGHQDARTAAGILTFYNGSFSFQTIYAGIVFTGSDGGKVVTDQTETIPPNAPPQDGQASIAAHALHAGQAGNIPSLAINGTVSSSLYVKNLAPFTGGQDSRDYPIVTKTDIQRVANRLTPHLLQSEQAVLTSQLTASEALAPPTCTPTTTADHGPGSETTTVQVTVSASCTAVAYNQQAVQVQARQFLTRMAATQLGTGYTLTGAIHVTNTQATAAKNVVFSFTCAGTWVYTFSPQEQQHLKTLIASKTEPQALQLLRSQQGIASVTIAGVPDNQSLPEDLTHIHVLLLFGMA